MGASSSGLLDEAKISNIKGLVESKFQDFSVFYRQQYSAAYLGHLHQEVEPKKEGKSLLLSHSPNNASEVPLYQGCVKFSCWDEQGKKYRERYTVLRRDYSVEIHENMEVFSRGCPAKIVLQTAGGSVFTTEEESRAHLEQTCAGILSGDMKEDPSSAVSSPDVFAVYLHLPYAGHTCFLFQNRDERDQFLSALKTCIRHCNLDPWCDSSYECQAYMRALGLYRREKGCYESWEMLLGSEEKVLAAQVMEEVLPWLQSQLQTRVKGKKTERIKQWLATVQATYTLVLIQLTASLEALREECRKAASASQALIRSDLDQIMSSHRFLEEKVRVCICEEAEKVCSESVVPYMSSILEALTENISAGIQGMQQTLRTQMDSAFTDMSGGTADTEKALSTLHSISLDPCYRQVETLMEKLEGLKQRFGLSSTQRLVHSAHLEMEKLLDNAVYTLELFLQSSAKLQPSQIPDKMQRAKERVLKQLDHDSRVVQRRLYQEALLEITLPALSNRMDSKRKTELQQFEQYIFADYSAFILVQNIYDDVLRKILTKEIETAVQDVACKKSNNLSLDTCDLAISQYSLLGQTPPRSAPGSPAVHARDSSSAEPSEEPVSVVAEGGQDDPELNADVKSNSSASQSPHESTVLLSPVIIVTQQVEAPTTKEASSFEETPEEVQLGTDTPSTAADTSNLATPDSDTGPEVGSPDASAKSESTDPIPDSPNRSTSLSSLQSTDCPADSAQSDQSAVAENSATPDLSASDQVTEDTTSDQHPCSTSHLPCTDDPMKISLGSLTEAITCNSAVLPVMQMTAQQTTDRAVYLSGEIKDNWEAEREKEERDKDEAEKKEAYNSITEEGKKEGTTGEEKEEEIEGGKGEGQMGSVVESELIDESCRSSEPPAESTTTFTPEQRESAKEENSTETGSELETDTRKEARDEAEEADCTEKEGKKENEEEEEVLQSPQPMESKAESAAEPPLDSVALIRELVTEITEVETVVIPPNSDHTP